MEFESSMESMVNKNQFSSVYNGKRVLITGNTGFKGSWLSLWLEKLGSHVLGVSLEKDFKGSHFELLNLKQETRFVDITNFEHLDRVIEEFNPHIIFHLAAQPIVKMAMEDPLHTFNSNLIGTLNLFESSRKNGVKYIINVTSDKVYKNLEKGKIFKETDIIGGNDLYSASKASVEIMTDSYRKVFNSSNLFITNVRSGNVIGGGDWGDFRLIPDIVRSYNNSQPIYLRNPKSIRPWQHVLSTISGYLCAGEYMLNGLFFDSFNFGPNKNEIYSVESVLQRFKNKWSDLEIINDPNNLYESNYLLIDSNRARKELKWDSLWDFEISIQKTIEWYDQYLLYNKVVSNSQLEDFVEEARKKQIQWALN